MFALGTVRGGLAVAPVLFVMQEFLFSAPEIVNYEPLGLEADMW